MLWGAWEGAGAWEGSLGVAGAWGAGVLEGEEAREWSWEVGHGMMQEHWGTGAWDDAGAWEGGMVYTISCLSHIPTGAREGEHGKRSLGEGIWCKSMGGELGGGA